jgi:hypothetical protein
MKCVFPLSVGECVDVLFHRFADPADPELAMTDGGVAELCSELDLSPVDVRVLILAWKCDAVTMCRFTQQQWLQGGLALGPASSLAQLRAGLERCSAAVLADVALFRQLYCWTFRFGKRHIIGAQKEHRIA